MTFPNGHIINERFLYKKDSLTYILRINLIYFHIYFYKNYLGKIIKKYSNIITEIQRLRQVYWTIISNSNTFIYQLIK